MQQENMLHVFLLLFVVVLLLFVVDTAPANSLCLRVDKGGGSDFSFHISHFTFHLSACIIHPLPLLVLSLSQGEKV